jgi:hypothetical protein
MITNFQKKPEILNSTSSCTFFEKTGLKLLNENGRKIQREKRGKTR